jgi:hypothetical protein
MRTCVVDKIDMEAKMTEKSKPEPPDEPLLKLMRTINAKLSDSAGVKMLMAGTKDVVDKFVAAEEFWNNFFKAHRDGDVKTLADALRGHQMEFETKLDWHRDLAKQIMPYTCLAYLYHENSGFGDNRDIAHRIVKAFAGSNCSTEVKDSAEEAAKCFGLECRQFGRTLLH